VQDPAPVLVSWVAFSNDPFERNRDRSFRLVNGEPVLGPTLMLLTDPDSEYAGRITDAVLLRQAGADAAVHERGYEELVEAIADRCPTLRLHPVVWDGDDPTDHAALFEFLRDRLAEIRRKFAKRELVLHVSPGTPAMHTVSVLMAETGFIEPPFRLVKSLRPSDRRGRAAVASVQIGIDTFYKRYLATQPRTAPAVGDSVRWDPARFRSPNLIKVFQEARRVAPLRVPVLILGERGTGKTTLASWIRASSPYRKASLDEAWPNVACGQYTPETMRAELFGYRKGAFTGAEKNRDGLLNIADGDTLFLDEIGDVSKDLQRLLIKAIEEGRFQPLGATELESTDFRLLTATNLSLSTLSERLDPDFLDRVGAYVLRLPSLRETPDDLDWMWDAVVAEASRRARVDPRYAKQLERERSRVLSALKGHPLPGNIRDLFRVAWRYLAARADHSEPLAPSDAVTYALAALDGPEASGDDDARTLARAFADGRPIPAALIDAGPIRTDEMFAEVRTYLATELRRIARERKVSAKDVADVGERTLREWARKDPAGEAES
jgi:DNA-binding NtrC family response regulator